jgi:hypothetical protein
VVSFVDEPVDLVLAFVAHYRALGAVGIHLCLDRRRDDVAARLAGAADVHLTVMDAAFWTGLGRARAGDFMVRQAVAMAAVVPVVRADWLLHVDCDEFLHPGAAVEAQLAAAPEEAMILRVPVVERVMPLQEAGPGGSILSGRFKRAVALSPAVRQAVWGDLAGLVDGMGFHGQAAGKSFVRTGQGLVIGPHFAVPEAIAGDLVESLAWVAAHGMTFDGLILHFDGLTRLHWVFKMLARRGLYRAQLEAGHAAAAEAWPGLRQVAAVHARVGDAVALRDLAARVQALDARQEAILAGEGVLVDVDHGIAARAAAAFPAAPPDLSVGAFDAALQRLRPGLAGPAGLAPSSAPP